MDDTASEIARLRAALAASEARAASAEADLAQVRAVVTTSEAMIRHLKLEIAKIRREQYGQSSERRARLIDQMELQLEELEADATEDEIAAERVAAKITNVSAFERRQPTRKPFPEHLPRETVRSEGLKRFLDKPEGQWPVLRLPDDAAKAIKARDPVAMLSAETTASLSIVTFSVIITLRPPSDWTTTRSAWSSLPSALKFSTFSPPGRLME